MKDVKSLIAQAYLAAKKVNDYFPKLEKDEQQIVCGAFEKRFKELNKDKH